MDTEGTPSVRALIDQQMRRDRMYGLDPKTGAKCDTVSDIGETLAQQSHEDSPSPKASPTAKGTARSFGIVNSPHSSFYSQSAPSLPCTPQMTVARSIALEE